MVQFNKHQCAEFAKIAGRFDLDLILLFGSQVKTGINLASDVDIAVRPKKDLKLSSYSLLIHFLGKATGNYNIDLTLLKHVKPLLLGQIAKNCQLLYEGQRGVFQKFRLSAMKKYVDAWPIFRVQELYLRRKIKAYKRELSR